MAKQLLFSEDARRKLLSGAEQIAEAKLCYYRALSDRAYNDGTVLICQFHNKFLYIAVTVLSDRAAQRVRSTFRFCGLFVFVRNFRIFRG